LSKIKIYSGWGGRCYAGVSARNTAIPHGAHYKQTVDNLGHWLNGYGRCLAWFGMQWESAKYLTEGYPVAFHTGPGVNRIIFFTVAAPPYTSPPGQPSYYWETTDGTTATLGSIYTSRVINTAVQPGETRLVWQEYTCTEDTDYQFQLLGVNEPFIWGGCVYERKHRTTTPSAYDVGDVAGEVGDDAPILHTHIREPLELAEQLWKRKSSPIFCYSPNWVDTTTAGTAYGCISITSTTYVNAFDSGTTAWSSTSLGCVANTEYMGTEKRRLVPVRVHIYAEVDGGTGTFKLVDTDGDLGSAQTWTETTPTWKTISLTGLADQSGGHKIDFHAKVTSTDEFFIHSIKVDQYEA